MGKMCVMFYFILINLLIILSNSSNYYVHAQVDLCFLADGSSSETFTINEAVPVGSIIGVLKVRYILLVPLFTCFCCPLFYLLNFYFRVKYTFTSEARERKGGRG